MLAIFHIGFGIFCLLIASLADAHAVNYATKVWISGKFQLGNILRVFSYYLVSIIPFVYSIKFFSYELSISPSIQVLVWFLSTVLFISIIDKSFFGWNRIDQLLGILLVIGLSVLAYRTH